MPVAHALWLWGKAGGPLVTLVLSVAFVLVARPHGTFVWATAAFTQASLRLFPLGFESRPRDAGAVPFSDEGELARAVSGAVPVRVALVLVCCAVSDALRPGRRAFPFRRRRWLGVAAVYLGSLAVGIGAVLADELLGIHGR